MRFLTAYYAIGNSEVILTGSERMKERPIGPLVDALRNLGAEIEYMEKKGCPPLKILGGMKTGGSISIDGGISSQFISALMMIGPVLEGGLQITLTGHVVSATYIEMTRALMNACGIGVLFNGREVRIPQMKYSMERYMVESDWSGASYWYQVAALLPGSVISLPHLMEHSLQGDSVLVELFEPLGVESRFEDDGVTLVPCSVERPELFQYDFTGCPDLVQTCAATLCAMEIPFRFTGTRTLRVKETDRIHALQNELSKLGFVLQADKAGEWIAWDGSRCNPAQEPVIRTYHDHRMAMAFAPLAIKFGPLTMEEPMVVTKSYPGFWNDMEKVGFEITSLE
jgi:3-phosphoshikimate 1-carboxyvinyltransferase